MYTQRLVSQSLMIVLAAGLAACGSKSKPKGGSDAPAPLAPAPAPSAPVAQAPATPVATAASAPVIYDANLAKEYAQLPPNVMIGANTDASGTPVNGTAQMRYAPTGASVGTPAQAFSAYDSGSAKKVDELDKDTSAQSWSTYQNVNNYGSYAPAYKSTAKSGYTFNYGYTRTYNSSGRVLYVYDRPACSPQYCAANGASVPAAPPSNVQGDWDSQLLTAFQRYNVYAINSNEFLAASPEKAALGQRLFNDTLLSSTGDMACASCHLDQRGTSNDYALVGTNLVQTGKKSGQLLPTDVLGRNTPALYNVGHVSYQTFFWDDRIAKDQGQAAGYDTPAGNATPKGLESALAAQALFPLVIATEMGCPAGYGRCYDQSIDQTTLWNGIMGRVMARQDYQQMFAAAFPEAGGNYGIQHLANAIAAFESVRWRATNSAFDQYVAGNRGALNDQQKRGAVWFYGKGGCAECHSGPLQTDHFRHSTGTPQFGPGGDGPNGWEDYGYGRISKQAGDRYKFRTPSLRNVAVSGPWGHDGAWSSLRQVVEHYVNPAQALDQWNPQQVILPAGSYLSGTMLAAWNDPAARNALKAATEAKPVALSETDVDDIMEFLLTLTDANVAKNDHSTVLRNN